MEVISQAVAEKKCVELKYEGYSRIVEVHAFGASAHGHDILHVYQVRGGSHHHEPEGWKTLRVDEIKGVAMLGEDSEAPRDGYEGAPSSIVKMYCAV